MAEDSPSGDAVSADPVIPDLAARRGHLRQALALRATRRQAIIGILFVLLGFAAMAATRAVGGSALLATARPDEVVRVLDDLTERQARLEIEQRALVVERDRLLSGSEEQRLAASRARVDALAILAGTVPATGPGISLTIADPNGAIDYSVILSTIQELRDAGAEAISMGPVRVVASSWFDDVPDGIGIVVSGRTLLPPYRILAIGDAATLATAMAIPGGVSDIVRAAGARISISPQAVVVVSALQPLVAPQYAQPAASPGAP
ncbi:unannotated protein [freshwater metagenome]|uniref:Unannotated protein n=1 Tax=freshwater metagenome TaxID=449393 RepID=A0A6J7RTL8_9ZZZZ|nr:DUF881 domain-containing protein [Actinomycetota bacterium]MSW35963.1 DUF881 domain-containing protein [Actinomycetota bacterium]